jgi:hypothetical protein
MNYLEAVPAIRRIDSSRDDLFAIDVVGEVNSADAENLYGLLEAACALHPRIDVLVRLTDFEIADWSETSPQTIEQGRQMALANVRRCASVGGPDWTRRIRADRAGAQVFSGRTRSGSMGVAGRETKEEHLKRAAPGRNAAPA